MFLDDAFYAKRHCSFCFNAEKILHFLAKIFRLCLLPNSQTNKMIFSVSTNNAMFIKSPRVFSPQQAVCQHLRKRP